MAKNENKESSNNSFLLLTSIVAIVAIVAIIVLVSGNKQVPTQTYTETYGVPVQVQTAGEILVDPTTEDLEELPIDEENLIGDARYTGSRQYKSLSKYKNTWHAGGNCTNYTQSERFDPFVVDDYDYCAHPMYDTPNIMYETSCEYNQLYIYKVYCNYGCEFVYNKATRSHDGRCRSRALA